MRLLIACSTCQRRYDATGREPGSRFHCHCGAIVTIEAVAGHEAAVTRCSGCGGPRTPGAVNCGFCGAEFAADEVTKKTVCPQCMTRCRDGSQFCHNCGSGLGAESVGVETTDLVCPVCGDGKHLEHHQLGEGPAMLECPSCAGIWLEHSKVKELVDQAKEQAAVHGSMPSFKPNPVVREHQGPMYRSCPSCKRMMNRQNFGRASGIVIDVCKDHGTWFDADELPSILRWVEEGGLRKAVMLEGEEARRQAQVAEDRQQRAQRMGGGHGGGIDYQPHRGRDPYGDDLAEVVVEGVASAIGALAGWFRR